MVKVISFSSQVFSGFSCFQCTAPFCQAEIKLEFRILKKCSVFQTLDNQRVCNAINSNQPRISFAFLLSVVIRTNKQCSPSAVKEASRILICCSESFFVILATCPGLLSIGTVKTVLSPNFRFCLWRTSLVLFVSSTIKPTIAQSASTTVVIPLIFMLASEIAVQSSFSIPTSFSRKIENCVSSAISNYRFYIVSRGKQGVLLPFC
jgi:hypothetical protein